MIGKFGAVFRLLVATGAEPVRNQNKKDRKRLQHKALKQFRSFLGAELLNRKTIFINIHKIELLYKRAFLRRPVDMWISLAGAADRGDDPLKIV